jgi:soluble lytic murein transglycosylase-like protein
MKLNEVILEQEQLDEIKLKHAIAGAALAASLAAGGVHKHDSDISNAKIEAAQKAEKAAKSEADKKTEAIQKLTDIVLDKYDIPEEQAQKIVELTKKHESSIFKSEDLLAIIGIESSFQPNAKSNLKHDKAVGLTQVRPKIWGIKAKDLKGNLDKQIGLAAEILNKYYHKLGSKDKAVHAYNVGLTNVRHHKGLNPAYVTKWKQELKRYT